MIFIVGYSRSGTKMMNKILEVMQVSDVVPEIHFFEQLYQFESDQEAFEIDNDDAYKMLHGLVKNVQSRGGEKLSNGIEMSNVKKQVKNFIQNSDNITPIDIYKKFTESINNNRPIDPTPRNAYFIKQISQLISDSHFIYMLRDPRDCILSQSVKWKKYYYKKDRPLDALRYYFNYNPSLMAKFWRRSFKVFDSNKQKGNIQVIKYEEITENPFKVIKNIGKFLEENIPDKIDLSFIRSGNSRKWKTNFSKPELYIIESVLSTEMEKMDYEVSEFSISDKILGNLLSFCYWLKSPIALLINLSRVKNPWVTFKTRLLDKN